MVCVAERSRKSTATFRDSTLIVSLVCLFVALSCHELEEEQAHIVPAVGISIIDDDPQ